MVNLLLNMFLIVFEEIKTKINEIDLIIPNENEETAKIIGEKKIIILMKEK